MTKLSGLPREQVLADLKEAGPRIAPGRRRRGVRRPRAQADRARQGASRQLDRHPPRGTRVGHPHALHDALRPRRDLRGADRPPASPARPPGRDRRLPGLHPAAVPSREHGLRAARLALLDRLRRPAHDRRLAPHARQHPEREGVLDHDLDAARPGGAPLRRERHPGHGHGGADRPCRRRRDAAGGEGAEPGLADPRGGPGARAARHALQHREDASRDPAAGPDLLREHGAGLLRPDRRRRRAGPRRADRAQPPPDRGRDRRRPDLVDRVRPKRRQAAAAPASCASRPRAPSTRSSSSPAGRSSRCGRWRSRRRARRRSS